MKIFRFFKVRAQQEALYVQANRELLKELFRMGDRAYKRRVALQAIADCETPGANATVRRMAKIARDCLDETPAEIPAGEFVTVHAVGPLRLEE